MPSTEKLFQSTFNREFSSPDALAVLQTAVKEFPYFIPAQFFLLKKDMENKEQSAITSLLFNNPLRLNWLLLNEEDKKEVEKTIVNTTTLIEPEPVKTDLPQNLEELPGIVVLPETLNTLQKEDKPKMLPEEKEEELIFEPLYASDYFASQGIKISDEIKPDDKLGKQLKSFTEWLKSMKKVEPAKIMDEVTPVDITVQHMAEKSNTEGEVLTETMAEVFAQQGKHAKATEVYEKLSLLNPLKSAYFAAKIEHLKSI